MSSEPLSPADQPGGLYNPPNPIRRQTPIQQQPVEGFSRVVQENVKAPGPGDEFPRQPTTRATSGPTTIGTSSGQYYEIGGVVADVNGTPIYANKVISLLDPVFAAADRYLDQKDKDLADALTSQWRQKQITIAGGSLQVARDRAAARGENFDDLTHQQYRTWMSRIYYEKKVMPRIQVSATDIHDYYNRHRDREFTELGEARFRLIKIDKSRHGSPTDATALITGLRNRIVHSGESFEAIARSVNDDPRWLKSGGDLGTAIQQDAFAIPAVEQAVWATPVGEVTPVVDTNNALYLAKVESKKDTVVHAYDEEAVQTKIEYQLRAEQFRQARQKVRDALLRDAAVVSTQQMQNAAVEMAMQNYHRWAGK